LAALGSIYYFSSADQFVHLLQTHFHANPFLFQDILLDRRSRSAASSDPPLAEPLLTSLAHREIGWMCGEPMADYAHVVFQAAGRKNGDDRDGDTDER
jgi:hypothetical protein